MKRGDFLKSKKTKSKTKQSGERYRVNFKNPRVKKLCGYFELSEGRLSKKDFLSIGTKDIFYQMKHNGFIKCSGDSVIATPKLRQYVNTTHGTHISSSNSTEHSANVTKIVSLIPDSVIDRHAFLSQTDLEIRYKRDFRNDSSYQMRLDELKHQYLSSLDDLKTRHHSYVPQSEEDSYLEKFSYMKDSSKLKTAIKLLDTSPVLIPDFQITLRQDERSQFYENLLAYQETCTSDREQQFIAQTLRTVASLPQSEEVSICIEILSSNYRNREIFMHRNYSIVSGKTLILL